MATCAIAVNDKRTLARNVGKHLTARYGKRTHYSPTLVKVTMRRLNYPDIWDCWALSLFTSQDDFSAYHACLGEVCDYVSMNTDMLSAVDSGSLFDFISGDWSVGDLLPDVGASADVPDFLTAISCHGMLPTARMAAQKGPLRRGSRTQESPQDGAHEAPVR